MGCVLLWCHQLEHMLEGLAAFLVTLASWFTTLLHFMGLVNPNKQLTPPAAAAGAAGGSTRRKSGLQQVEAAAERISDRMEHLVKVRRGEGGCKGWGARRGVESGCTALSVAGCCGLSGRA
jgi:hypothetical protein